MNVINYQMVSNYCKHKTFEGETFCTLLGSLIMWGKLSWFAENLHKFFPLKVLSFIVALYIEVLQNRLNHTMHAQWHYFLQWLSVLVLYMTHAAGMA